MSAEPLCAAVRGVSGRWFLVRLPAVLPLLCDVLTSTLTVAPAVHASIQLRVTGAGELSPANTVFLLWCACDFTRTSPQLGVRSASCMLQRRSVPRCDWPGARKT